MSPHLDYYQDDEERRKFHEEFELPPPSIMPNKNYSEQHALVGNLDTEDEKLGVMLGIWKPISPSEVLYSMTI